MKNINFSNFVKKHLWLFIICILLPFLIIIGLLYYFNSYYLEQGTVATIVIGMLTYIGTILWGIFIYYKSWMDKMIQEYRDRPIVDMNVRLSNKVPLDYQMYEKTEVDEILDNHIAIHGLKQVQHKNVKYVLVTISNWGSSILSDISIQNIVIKNEEEIREQGSYGYISKKNLPKSITYGEKWELFVAIDKTIFDELKEGYKKVVITIKFKSNVIDLYYGNIILNTAGIGSYGIDRHIYSENEYIKLTQNKHRKL